MKFEIGDNVIVRNHNIEGRVIQCATNDSGEQNLVKVLYRGFFGNREYWFNTYWVSKIDGCK